MGRKVHPLGFRIGVIRDWQSKWYDEQHYADNILEDFKLRKAVQKKYPEAGISLIEIERQANKVGVTIHTARPGIVIGRGGSRVEEMRQYLEGILGGKKVQLDVREIRQPELDAFLVARSVAEQMERRVAYRRAMKQSIFRTMQAGAKGMRITTSGRLGGVEIARRQMMHQGRVPLQTLRADIDYGFTEAHTTLGRIGVKVWIYRGDVFPEAEAAKAAEAEMAAATPVAASVVAPVAASAAPEATPAAAAPAPQADTRTEEPAKAEVTETKKPRARKKAEAATEVMAETKPAGEAAAPPRAHRPAKAAEEKAEEKPSKEEKAVKAVAEKPARAKKAAGAEEKPAEEKQAKPAPAKAGAPKAKKAEETPAEAKETKPRAKKTE